MYLNKIYLIGNLTRDPELKSLPSGIKVTSFGLATNRVWRDQAGAKKEATEFHNVVVFGRQAETVAQYLKKGASALVEGRIQTRSWDDKDGTKKYRTEIIAERIQFGPKGGGGGGATGAPSGKAGKAVEEAGEVEAIEYPDEELTKDIPF